MPRSKITQTLLLALLCGVPGFSQITLNTQSLPIATQGTAYSTSLAANGGTPPYTFSVLNGVVPSGVSVSTAGVISGTPATAGNFRFILQVRDSSLAQTTVDFSLLLEVNSLSGLKITTASLANGQVGLGYSTALSAIGGNPPYIWDTFTGAGLLPNGLSIATNASNGSILGTPNFAGDYTFVVRVTDGNGLGSSALANFSIRINSSVLSINTTTLPNGSLGVFYNQPVSITGGVLPYSISIVSGAVPQGLGFSTSGVVSGTPTAMGTANFAVRVTDALNSVAQGIVSLTIGAAQFSINPVPLPTAQVGSTYSANVTATAGTSPYVLTILSGILPQGINFSNGSFTGVPTVSGNYPLTIQARDATNATVTANFTLVVNTSTLVITATPLSNAIINQPYSSNIVASGGQQPYVFSLLAGTLPPNFSLSSSTGTLSGTTASAGTYNFTVRVTDAVNAITQSSFSIVVSSSNLVLLSTALPNASVNQSYVATLTASGGTTPYLFSVIGGTVPPTLTLGTNGNLSGIPTTAGNYQVTFRVQDALGATAQSTVTITVSATGFRITTPFLSSGQLNQPYSANISAEGGTTPYVFFLQSGQLPPGITLNFNGLLSGTPTLAGNYTFAIRSLDSASNSADANFALSINSSGINLSSSTLPALQLNQAYTFTITATGGTGPYTYTVTSGGLAPGLTLSPGGALTGTPTASGTYNFVLRVQDSTTAFSIFNLSLLVNTSTLGITTVSLPGATAGVTYSTTINATGGTPPYSFTLNGGSLPSGLSLSSNGVLSGIPTSSGTAAFTVRVGDAQAASATANYNLTVSGTGTLTITTSALPSGQINQPYSASAGVSGGILPYTFTIIGGVLPPGLNLTSNGGISGTPTVGGNYTFILRVTDGFGAATQQSLAIQVSSSGLGISTLTLPNGQLGQFYTTSLSASGGTSPYTWSVVSGTLPNGVTLSTNGVLSGLPTTGGGFEVLIQVTDATSLIAQKNFNFVIGSSVLSFLTTSLPPAYLGLTYSAQLQVGGGAAPYVVSIIGGSLPAGLTMSSVGQITGTPTAVSFNTITFRVVDATSTTATVTLNLAVGTSTLQFSSLIIPTAAVGQLYNTALVVTGGSTPYTFSVSSGSLPLGMILSPAGVLSGTTAQSGVFNFTVRVQDAANGVLFQSFLLNVVTTSMQITTTSLPSGRVNQAYLQTIQTSGGSLPIRLEVLSTINSGFLPSGLTLSLTGVLSGTPQATGSFTFTVRATDAQNLTAQANYTLVILAAAPVITTVSLPAGTAGTAYSQNINAGGGAPPYTFSLLSGQLAPGLNLSPAGILSGNPTTPGSYSFTVRVSDAAQQTGEATYALVIGSGATQLTISAFAPPAGVLYFPYSLSLTATGGRQPYGWSIVQGPIPNGLRLDSNGVLNGLLLAPGTYRFTVRVTDANNSTAEATLGITVAGAARLAVASVGTSYAGRVPQPATGRTPFTYAVNVNALGDLPPGLTLSGDGIFTGLPQIPGEYTFGVIIRDANGFSSNVAVTIPVLATSPLRIVTPSLAGGTTGVGYNQTLTATGGREPYSWVVSSGTLPNGLILNPLSGIVSGTPTLPGSGFFVVRVTDANGATASGYYGISVTVAGSPTINAITSAASYGANGVAPGELLVLFGGTLGPQNLTTFSLENNTVPTVLGGTRVLFDGVAAPLIYSRNDQVSVIAPYNLEDRTSTRIVVEYLGFQSTPFLMPVVSSKPALFTVDGSGQGPAALLNENGSVNGPNNRAGRESIVVLYLTGGGAMTPGGVAGRVAAGISSLNQQTLVHINGNPVTVLYAGNAPGLVEGVIQVNVKLPQITLPGQNLIRVQIGPNATTANATVWVQ